MFQQLFQPMDGLEDLKTADQHLMETRTRLGQSSSRPPSLYAENQEETSSCFLRRKTPMITAKITLRVIIFAIIIDTDSISMP